jgi:hypothetical protein
VQFSSSSSRGALPATPLTLVVGAPATIGMAAFAVRTISGVDAAWSASVFVHLGMSLALGLAGAVTAALSDGVIGGILVRSGWSRSAFNTAAFTLTSLAAWAAAATGPGNPTFASGCPFCVR